jgi:outer membrane protein assembly factor BamB
MSIPKFLLALIAAGWPLAAAGPAAEEMVVVSGAISPRVAYGLSHENAVLTVRISVASFAATAEAKGIGLQLGLAADRVLRLSEKEATLTRGEQAVVYAFRVPDEKLVTSAQGWDKLRMAIAVSWPGGPSGQPRQRETFLQNPAVATHAGLSSSPENWQLVSLAEYQRAMADRRLQIAIDFVQLMDGKATIAIDDEQGRRVRNLLSGQAMSAGRHRIVWDGASDNGDTQPPGKYHWRSLSHPGLTPQYLFSFCDAPGSNHGTFHAATSNGSHVFLGTAVSEGGHEISGLAPDGRLIRGYIAPMGHGLARVALAADAKWLYAAYDGTAWGQDVDRSKPDWMAEQKVTLVRFDLATGNVVDFAPQTRAAVLRTYAVGPGSPGKAPDRLALAGLALFKKRLYLGDRSKNEVLEIDPATGAVARAFPLRNPVALAAGTDGLYALADGRLVELDPAAGTVRREIAALAGEPAGLTVGEGGTFYISDAQRHVIHVFDAKGKRTGQIGKDGGITRGTDKVVPGPYDPLRLHNPAGLALAADGHLWVTELDRWQPKRFAAYDPRTGTMWKEFFGPTAYGASNCGFDPEDSTRWIGQGTLFRLDFAAKTAKPLSILGGEEGRTYRFWRQDGRTFVIACGKATYVEELLPDNSLRPLALVSSAHQYAFAHDWKPPKEFVEAFRRDYPEKQYRPGVPGKPDHGFGMLWVDRNGDGKMQVDEIEFATAAKNFAGSGWSHDQHDLTFRVPATIGNKGALVVLRPEGWWPGGAPKYPPLNDAVKAARSVDLPPDSNMVESTVDRFGNLLLNSSPMRAFGPEGRLLWTYPNNWVNVHGSHDAPLPTAGELQGVLFFSGVAPLDDRSDVALMNGNHGRAFVMTTDGLYVDEMFPDCRLMTNPQAGGIGILGGECFGGTFGKSKRDGNYYFQGGGIEYRIYRVDGLRETARSQGELTVTPEQAIAAERTKKQGLADKAPPRDARLTFTKTPFDIDEKAGPWAVEPAAQWNRKGQFPVEVRAAHDGKTLYLSYSVKDGSPWVNRGKDWQLLFKTGDSVDLQLGADPSANPKRSGPVPGDLRLLIAPFEDGNIAVVYRHRLPGASDGVVFQCPWRSERVDSVRRLESAKIAVRRSGDSYLVKAAIPLHDLGLESPAIGKPLRCDFGVIYGDAEGTTNVFRNYWSNQATGLVNDVPGEIMLAPNLWGDATLEIAP